MNRAFSTWAADELERLKELNQMGVYQRDAAEDLGRSVNAIQQQSKRLGLSWKPRPAERRPMASSEAREPAIFVPTFIHSNLTARLCGDPPPGRSALDQRGQG